MVTSNIIQRVLKIKTRDGQGTTFVVEVEDRQYLITAKHLVGDPGARLINLYHDKQWKALEGEWIGQGSGDMVVHPVSWTALTPRLCGQPRAFRLAR